MAQGKLYTGIALDGEDLKIASIRISKKQIELVRLDKFTLIERLDKDHEITQDQDVFSELDDDLADDSVFDIDLDAALADDDESSINLPEDDIEDEILGDLTGIDEEKGDDIDLELDELESSDELVDVDLVDEAEAPTTNEVLLYNILSGISTKRVDIGLNIPAGVAIYQILKDVDFNEVKGKDLRIIIDDRLESLYGSPKPEDYYSYGIRDDGALLLSSIDGDSQLLQLVNRTQSLYRGKIFIQEILPDETILMGLIKANYELEDGGVTCLVQFAEDNCRVVFLKGSKLWLVSPIITEGTKSRKFLNTVFSKILFQLDTGEVPNLDRLIICNNSLHQEAVSFFQERFPDVEVSEFGFKEELFDPGNYTHDSIAPFTTAIGSAWAASGFEKESFSNISFLPKYVADRQKIFKLQWHGILMIVLIAISFPVINEYWRAASAEVSRLENEVSILDTQIQSFTPTVNNYNRINNELSQIQDKLALLNTLSENSITWSVNLDLINSGIEEIGGVWLTAIAVGEEENTLDISGVARYRNRIPQVAEIFADATLLNVTKSEIRGEAVYTFTYAVDKIVANTAVYTPQNLQALENLTGN